MQNIYKDWRELTLVCLDNIGQSLCKMCVIYKQLTVQGDLLVPNLFDLKVFLSVVDWQIFVYFEPC